MPPPTRPATRPPADGSHVSDAALLPERLRLRVVALVSAVLPSITPVPPQLRKVAGFAPARRARLGGSLIWEALGDDEFRGHAAVQVAAVPLGRDDPVDDAARAWLSRDEGWQARVDAVVETLGTEEARDDQDRAELARLTAQVAALQAELAALKVDHRQELDRASADHKVLRQRLGEARSALRAAEGERDAAVLARDEAVAAAETATRTAEADVRRLRAQLDEAEAGLAATRRDARSGRDAATVRARLLLDAVVDSATGCAASSAFLQWTARRATRWRLRWPAPSPRRGRALRRPPHCSSSSSPCRTRD